MVCATGPLCLFEVPVGCLEATRSDGPAALGLLGFARKSRVSRPGLDDLLLQMAYSAVQELALLIDSRNGVLGFFERRGRDSRCFLRRLQGFGGALRRTATRSVTRHRSLVVAPRSLTSCRR